MKVFVHVMEFIILLLETKITFGKIWWKKRNGCHYHFVTQKFV